jgi:hypothetical protein
VTTEVEEHEEDWTVEEPADGIVHVTHHPTGEKYAITVADVRGAEAGENELRAGPLDDYLRKRAINIAAQRMLTKYGD